MLKAILIVLAVFTSHVTFSQSIYQLKYSLPTTTDTSTFDALLVVLNEGTGIARVKSISPLNGEVILQQFDVQEQYMEQTTDSLNSGKLFYVLSKQKSIRGNVDINAAVPLFCFKNNPATNAFEPWGVANSTTDTINSIPFKAVNILESKDLKEDLVLQYFNKTDDFYQKLFKAKPRALSIFQKQTKLFLITVANINDPTIGNSCRKDRDRIIQAFKYVADTLGIKLDTTIISGENYNKINVENTIKSLAPSSNDIVVFYYSGHGFRKDKDTRNFPYIDLRSKPDGTFNENSLNIEDIYNTISRKGARLNLVLSDCCNTKVDASNAVGSPVPAKKGTISWSLSNCQALFLNPKPMSILATAANRDQKAASNNDFGGFFSYFFKSAMEDHFSFLKLNVNWESVLKQARKQTVWKAQHTYCAKPHIPQNICNQTPVASVNNRSLLF